MEDKSSKQQIYREIYRMTEPKTLREIAEEEGISHQAVTEIIERALKKIAKELVKRGIKKEHLL